MKGFFGAIGSYFRKTNSVLWLTCLLTSAYGSALVYSATRTSGFGQFQTQVTAILIGYVAAIIISLIDYRFIAKCWPAIAVVCLGMMAATSLFGETVAGTDDTAWIYIGSVSIQPSELVKIGFIVTLAKHLEVLQKKEKLKNFWHLALVVVHAIIPIVIIHIQGDDGSALVFGFIFLVMCLGAGVQFRYFLIALGGIGCAVPLFWKYVMNADQKKRFQILLDHTLDPLGYGYQQGQGEISLGVGGLSGSGYLEGSRVESSMVPEDHNDFIFTVAGEEFGFIGCVAILLLLIVILFAVLHTGLRAGDVLGQNICFGFFGMIAFQMIANVGMCLYLLPVIGITLPFFSAGGTSAACIYFGVGLIQSVAMHPTQQIEIGMLQGESY